MYPLLRWKNRPVSFSPPLTSSFVAGDVGNVDRSARRIRAFNTHLHVPEMCIRELIHCAVYTIPVHKQRSFRAAFFSLSGKLRAVKPRVLLTYRCIASRLNHAQVPWNNIPFEVYQFNARFHIDAVTISLTINETILLSYNQELFRQMR